MSTLQVLEAPSDVSEKVISRAVGEELRRAREALGLVAGATCVPPAVRHR